MPYVGYVSKELLIAMVCMIVLLAELHSRRLAVAIFVVLMVLFGLLIRPYYIPAILFAVVSGLVSLRLASVLAAVTIPILALLPSVTGLLI